MRWWGSACCRSSDRGVLCRCRSGNGYGSVAAAAGRADLGPRVSARLAALRGGLVGRGLRRCACPGAGLDGVRQRLRGRLHDRLDGLRHRLDDVRHRLGDIRHGLGCGLHHRLHGLGHRLDGLGHRLDDLRNRLGDLRDRLCDRLHDRLHRLRDGLRDGLDRLRHGLDGLRDRLDCLRDRLSGLRHRLEGLGYRLGRRHDVRDDGSQVCMRRHGEHGGSHKRRGRYASTENASVLARRVFAVADRFLL